MNLFNFIKSGAKAVKGGFDVATGGKFYNSNNTKKSNILSTPFGAVGLGGAIGATIGAGTVGSLSEGTINPLVGAAVGGTIGALALPSIGFTVGSIGELGTKGIGALRKIPYGEIGSGIGMASASVLGVGAYALGTIGSQAWNFSKRLVNWDEGADTFKKVVLTGPISGFKQGLDMETVDNGLLGKIEKAGNAVKGGIVNGKGLLLTSAIGKGVGEAWREVEQARMGTNMGVVTSTPRIPSYQNNAGATGDLVFALNANRRG